MIGNSMERLRANPAVNRTRRFVASTWRAAARRAGYLSHYPCRDRFGFDNRQSETNRLGQLWVESRTMAVEDSATLVLA